MQPEKQTNEEKFTNLNYTDPKTFWSTKLVNQKRQNSFKQISTVETF